MYPRVKYHHRKRTARCLLLTGYLFFFAIQFNGKYYDVANFFVYKHDAAKTNLTAQKTTHALAYRLNPQRPAHLSIDKRFPYKTTIQSISTTYRVLVPCYIIITRKALPPPIFYATPDLPTNSFRGPPIS
ncbi:hypothetical protein [Puia sp.]|jgi:hypothetical protein|uniref:hypothetical protein n=1 Tax=Puia sp. TaxID=2045100 RepID=UPI002F3F0A42